MDIHLWKLTILFVSPQPVLYNLTTKRGMGVKHASCVEASVDQRLGDLQNHFCKQLHRDLGTCFSVGFHGDNLPYANLLQSASVEVFKWNAQ